MSNPVYKINLRSGDATLQFQRAIQEIFAKKAAQNITNRVAKVIDREVSKVFYYTAIDIFQNNFADIEPYVGLWRPYAASYKMRKQRRVGHLDFFKFGGYSRAREGEEQLADELFGIQPRKILDNVGTTQVSLSKDNKLIRISIAPRLRFSKANMERQFTGLISSRALKKLQNRKRAYRALIGPEFMAMLNDRIPAAVDASLGRA